MGRHLDHEDIEQIENIVELVLRRLLMAVIDDLNAATQTVVDATTALQQAVDSQPNNDTAITDNTTKLQGVATQLQNIAATLTA